MPDRSLRWPPACQDFTATVGVDASGEYDDGVDDPSAFADFHRQCVGCHERERTRVAQGPVAELGGMLIKISGHARDLGLRHGVHPQGFNQLIHPARGDPGEVAVSDHGDHRSLSTLAALQQPLGEVGALAQLGDRDVDRAHPGVQVAMAVAVALGDASRSGFAPVRADDRGCVGGQQGVHHGLQELTHQIWGRVGQEIAQQASRVDNMRCGHRETSIRVRSSELLEGLSR